MALRAVDGAKAKSQGAEATNVCGELLPVRQQARGLRGAERHAVARWLHVPGRRASHVRPTALLVAHAQGRGCACCQGHVAGLVLLGRSHQRHTDAAVGVSAPIEQTKISQVSTVDESQIRPLKQTENRSAREEDICTSPRQATGGPADDTARQLLKVRQDTVRQDVAEGIVVELTVAVHAVLVLVN